MNTWKPILAALVIFAAGVVTGGLTVKLRTPPAAPRGPRPVDQRPLITQRWEGQLRELARKMEKQLELSADQRGRIEAIVRDSQSRMRGIWDEVAPRAREEFRRTRQQIREVLTPEQRKRYEELFREREGLGKRGETSAPASER